MGFRYRRDLDGDGLEAAKDFTLDATYASTAKVYDVVRLNAAGQVVLAATGDTNVLGAISGLSFEGLGKNPLIARVNIDPDAMYEADFVGAGALTVGFSYGIDGNSNLDTADTTVLIAKIVEVVKGKPIVVISSRQLI